MHAFRLAAVLLCLASWTRPVEAQDSRPPGPGQPPACLVWWQAPDHLGEHVVVCGTPQSAVERDGLLMLLLGPKPTDLRLGLPLALRSACPAVFAQIEAAPALARLRASGDLAATPDGPLLRVATCDQLTLESRTAAAGPSECAFTLGFKALHDLIPDIVGDCAEDERHNPDNGDGLQRTTNGLLVWRKADNWTAFTDGATTWINGPNGLQSRPNSERFPWEGSP